MDQWGQEGCKSLWTFRVTVENFLWTSSHANTKIAVIWDCVSQLARLLTVL